MLKITMAMVCLLVAVPFTQPLVGQLALTQAAEPLVPESIDEQATHVDSGKIQVPGINAFAINRAGNILAACGAGPGEIKILDADGSVIRTWNVDFKPESISSTPTGDVLVAGIGKICCFSIDGKQRYSADSPHVQAIRDNSDQLRQTAIARLKGGSQNYQATVDAYKRIIQQLQDKDAKGELTEQEGRALSLLPNTLKIMEERLAEQKKAESGKESTEPAEEDIQRLVDSMMRSKMRMSSISSDGQHVYVTTAAAVGYGFDVWKMKPDLTGSEPVVKGLRGCCGQMDVQCCENGLYVAENTRHRVVCYDKQGEEKFAWGKRDRSGVDGFTSCCNPMNVCFANNGDVFTAESNTGRIKRFNKEGDFLSYVGDVSLVPGCKNVSIAVSSTTDQVYMLDITRGCIVVMKKKPAGEKAIGSET